MGELKMLKRERLKSLFFVQFYLLTKFKKCDIMAGRGQALRPEFSIILYFRKFVKQKIKKILHKFFPKI
jgi:hypothetical protein